MTFEEINNFIDELKHYTPTSEGNYKVESSIWSTILDTFNSLLKEANRPKDGLKKILTNVVTDRLRKQMEITKFTQCYPSDIRQLGELFGVTLTKEESKDIYQVAKIKALQIKG